MKMPFVCSLTVAAVLLSAASAATPPDTAQVVVTVQPAHQGGPVPDSLAAADVTVLENKSPVHVMQVQHLPGDLSDLQLFIYLDDSTRSSSLGTHLAELKKFVQSLPGSAQVAIGYMRNGTFAMAQPFTTDHAKAAAALRLPEALPGVNGSPYFALSDLVKHWPSKDPGRRTVLMMTDGVDRYFSGSIEDDPYVDTAITDALKNGVEVSSIYLRGSGLYGRGAWTTTMAQSRLMQVTEETGGYSYFEAMTDPVDIAPFLNDFHHRLEDQYEVTFAVSRRGEQPLKLQTELPGVKIEGPSMIYVK